MTDRSSSGKRGGLGLTVSLVAMLVAAAVPMAAQPFTQQIAPLTVERSDGSIFLNPFSGGLSQPRISLRDFDRDGLPDLFTLSPDNRLRLYRNEGSLRLRRVHPSPFDAVRVRSWFRFADIDADGDDDLYTAGARSEVLFLRNDGTQTAPVHHLPADTLKGADGTPITMQQETVPSLVDIDGDGDLDFFSGNLDGSITFYENTGTPQAVTFTFRTPRYEEILVVSNGPGARKGGADDDGTTSASARHGASVLDFVDLDADGDLDLLFGDFFTRRLLYFPNAGTPRAASFSMATLDTAFGPAGDLVESEGFNQPTSGDIDRDGDIDVVVSSLLPFSTVAPIILYENRGTATAPLMRRSTLDPTGEIDIGSYAAPTSIQDLDRHGILVGSTSGALTYFEESRIGTQTVWRVAGRYPTIAGFLQAAPATGDLDGDGRAEVIVGESEGRLRLYRFSGSGLLHIASMLDTISVNQYASPALADLDGDLDLDLLVGTGGGRFLYLRNNGSTSAPLFERATAPAPFDTLDVGKDAAPRFYDLDRDGDQDAIIGSRGDNDTLPNLIRFRLNQGGVFIPSPSYPEIVTARNPVPLYRDISEGRYLFIGNALGGMTALRDEKPSRIALEADHANGVRMSMSGGNPRLEWSGSMPGRTLRVIDILGATVLEQEIPEGADHIEIDRRALVPGVYLWQIGKASGKIMR